MKSILLASTAGLCLSACAAMPDNRPAAAASTAPQTVSTDQAAHEELFALFSAADEANLKRNPLEALFRGDDRYADRLGDYLSDAYDAAEKKAAEDNLAALNAIDRAALSQTDRIAYDVFAQNQKAILRGFEADVYTASIVRPINHFSGFHTFYPGFASGKGAAPFKTLADYENNLKRHAQFLAISDRAIDRFRQGMDAGIFETKLTIRNVIDQLDTQLAIPVEESPYYAPVTMFPDTISAADQARLQREYRAMVVDGIYPSYRRTRDFLENEYLPLAREEVGLSAMKGGAAYYDYLLQQTTTLDDVTADGIHHLGLSEVARIRGEMEKVKAEVGFEGTLAEFFEFIRTDPQFKPESREALTANYYAIEKKVQAQIPSQFATLPEAPLEIRPYEEYREKYEAGGSYQSGTPDGSRPGIFYFNAYDLPSRTTPGETTLFLHEGAPGHHFQISLAQENEALPNFMRFGGNTAYVEGWALYAESLGYPMGLLNDPYQRFGSLDDEMLRAMRLVVDTGLHSKGWGRDKAIAYMLANSGMGKTDATAEVERYIAIPSQAVAYKIGALTIQRLKKQAEAALGDRFDPREFHDQVLGTGALPLSVLDAKIQDWIAAKG